MLSWLYPAAVGFAIQAQDIPASAAGEPYTSASCASQRNGAGSAALPETGAAAARSEIADLIDALICDADSTTHAEAALRLVGLGDAAIPDLVRTLGRPDLPYNAEGRLAWVLGHSPGDPNDELLAWLRVEQRSSSGEPWAGPIPAESALDILAQRGASSLPVVETLLGADDEAIRIRALRLAAALGAQAATLEPRVGELAESASAEERSRALTAINQFGAAASGRVHAWLVSHPSPQVRRRAALTVAADPQLLPTLLWVAQWDAEPSVREAASASFGHLLAGIAPGALERPVLAPLLEGAATMWEGDPDIAAAIAGALDRRSPEFLDLAPRLLSMVENADGAAGEIPASALRRIVGVLATIPEDSNMRVRLLALASRSLDLGNAERAIVVLEALHASVRFPDADDPLVRRVLQALPRAERPRQVSRLAALATDRSWLADALTQEIRAWRMEPAEAWDRQDAYQQLLIALAEISPASVSSLAQTMAVASRRDEFCLALVPMTEPVGSSLGDLEDARDEIDAMVATFASLYEQACRRPFLGPAMPVEEELAQIRAAPEEVERRQRLDTFIEHASGAPNGREALLALLNGEPVAPAFETLEALCRPSALMLLEPADFDAELDRSSWGDVSLLGEFCPSLGGDADFGWAIAERLDRDPAGFSAWAARNNNGEALLESAVQALAEESPPSSAHSLLERLAVSPDSRIARWSLRAISRLGLAGSFRNILLAAVGHEDASVAAIAADTAVAAGLIDLGDEADRFAQRATALLVLGGVAEELEEAALEYRAPQGESSAPSSPVAVEALDLMALPRFPWPPPQYSHRIDFGQDASLALLGNAATSLGTVHRRIIRALRRISAEFERGLFLAPGGFALMTRLEQTDNQGRPLPGGQRWLDVRPPPRSLKDYLTRLFLAPPGHYRTIVFVFTSRPNFQPSNLRLPDIRQGGGVLPDAIAARPLGEVHALALVYHFARRDGGHPRLSRELGGPAHLVRSGLAAALREQ